MNRPHDTSHTMSSCKGSIEPKQFDKLYHQRPHTPKQSLSHPKSLLVKKENCLTAERPTDGTKFKYVEPKINTFYAHKKILNQDFNTEMVKIDTKSDAPQRHIVPPKAPAEKVKVVRVQ